MQDQNLFLRNDTILGVCEGIGSDFGFNPNWLRLALCLAFFFNPAVVALSYIALGVPVAAARFFFPAPAPKASVEAVETPPSSDADDEEQALPLAA